MTRTETDAGAASYKIPNHADFLIAYRWGMFRTVNIITKIISAPSQGFIAGGTPLLGAGLSKLVVSIPIHSSTSGTKGTLLW
jgi:hypothetical protein